MRRPVGTAIRVQRPAMIGWTLGAVAFMGMLGGLAQQAVSAIADNKSLADALNTSIGNLADGFYAIGLVYLALIVIGYIAAAFAAVRREESSNRIEPVVGASVARSRWLAANTLAAAAGALVVCLAGTLTFALSAAASIGDAGLIGELVRAGLAYLPAYLAVVGIACALFGLQPRAYPLMWAVVGAIAFIAFLGPGLNMPTWVARSLTDPTRWRSTRQRRRGVRPDHAHADRCSARCCLLRWLPGARHPAPVERSSQAGWV